MTTTKPIRVGEQGPAATTGPVRIHFTAPSSTPVVAKATGRGSVQPLRYGRFLVMPGDRIAMGHLLRHHVAGPTSLRRLDRWFALAALNRGLERVAAASLRRRFGAESKGVLEVEHVWVAVRATLNSCGLKGIRIRVHKLDDPTSGLAGGATLVGFGRKESALESTRPLVVLRVAPSGVEAATMLREARALAAVRAPLSASLRPLIPAPLGRGQAEGLEVLATGFVEGRPLHLDLPRGRWGGFFARKRMVAVAGALAQVQNAQAVSEKDVLDGSEWPEEASDEEWSIGLRNRLNARPLPMLISHGDLRPENVLVDGRRVTGFVDWRHTCSPDIPTRDLFQFLLTFAQRLHRGSHHTGAALIRHAFVERNAFSRAVRRALNAYGQRRELGLPMLGALFRLHLITTRHDPEARSPFRTDADLAAGMHVLDSATETVFSL